MSDGEFDIIERYFAAIGFSGSHVAVGPGDDCAVLSLTPGHELCVSTDSLVEGVHFPHGARGNVVAARAFGAAMSDLAAMGARPVGITGALVFQEVDRHWLQDFSDSLSILSANFETPLVGGNLARGPLCVTLNVMGEVPVGEALLRSGASVGDDLYISGHPGEAAAALRVLDRLDDHPLLQAAYENPLPRLALGQQLRGVASAAIDVSDGLLADAGHLAAASGVALDIDSTAIPLSAALLQVMDPDAAQDCALTGGDDYELLFTAPAAAAASVLALTVDVPVTRIGRVLAGDGVTVDGRSANSTGTGWRHF